MKSLVLIWFSIWAHVSSQLEPTLQTVRETLLHVREHVGINHWCCIFKSANAIFNHAVWMSLTSWATSESGCHSRKLGSADIFNIRLFYVLQLCVPVPACFWTIGWLKCSCLTIKPKLKKPPPELFLQLLSVLLLTSEEWQLIWAPIMLWFLFFKWR